MTIRIDDMSQRKVARIAGLLYLIYIVTFAFSSFVQSKPIAGGDAAATARISWLRSGYSVLGS